MKLRSFGKYIWHDIAVQKDYLGSYIFAFLIILSAYFININHNDHKSDGHYWISPLEGVFNTSFRNLDMTSVIMAFGILIALFVFVITVVIKRNRIVKTRLMQQFKIQEARDDLLALASHQLRTPATGVKQYLGIIREDMAGDVTEKQRKLIDKAYFYNERQLRIINDFLYMAKLDAERIVVHNRNFDLVELTIEVIKSHDFNINKKNLKVELKSPAQLMIDSDKQCIRMAIENLLSNSVKYTKPGGSIHIKIEKHEVTTSIIIKDSGVGIRRTDTGELFKKFSRIKNSLSSDEGGSGIGLYIAKKLVELNHGEITYKPVSGGSKFTIELPL